MKGRVKGPVQTTQGTGRQGSRKRSRKAETEEGRLARSAKESGVKAEKFSLLASLSTSALKEEKSERARELQFSSCAHASIALSLCSDVASALVFPLLRQWRWSRSITAAASRPRPDPRWRFINVGVVAGSSSIPSPPPDLHPGRPSRRSLGIVGIGVSERPLARKRRFRRRGGRGQQG